MTSRSFLAAFAVLSITSLVASAQTTYEWNGDGAGTTNPLLWDGTTSSLSSFWEDLTTPADPAATPPGSNLNSGALDDLVIIRNPRPTSGGGAQQTAQVRLTVDAGTVDSVLVGGYKDATASGAAIAPPAGGNWATQFDLRGSGTLTVTNDVTLGEVDVDRERAGQLQFLPNGNTALLTVEGNIVSGSGDPQNRIIIRGTGAGGLDLSGNIDTATTGGSAGGTREIDLRLESDIDANPFRFFLFFGGQTLSVDDFWIGERFNGNVTGAFTLEDANVVEANVVRIGSTAGNANNGPPRTATGTLTINNVGSSVDAFGTSGENGNIQVGAALGNYDDTQTATGTLTVTTGRIGATNALDLGLITRNAAALAGDRSATGTVTLDAAAVTHLIGRVDGTGGNANQLAGAVNVGREGTGTLNLNAGTLVVYGPTHAGGDNQDGRDRGSSGTINVGNGATLLVKDVDPAAALVLTTDGTTARDQSVTVGGGNLEIGRDGDGTLNVDGGTIVIGHSNLVLGQNSAAAVNGLFDGNMDGTTDDIVGLNANFDILDASGAFVISTDPADGDIEDDGTPDGDLAINYVLTAQGEGKLLPNISRGTVNLTNGASVTVGGTYTATTGNPEATPDVDVNFNNGGGDMVIDGSTLDVADSIAMGAVGPANARNTLTIRNASTVTAGFRDSIDGGNLAGQASDITIVGSNTITITDDLLLNGSTDLTLDFGGAFVSDFGFDVLDNASLNGAELIISGTSVLAGSSADVLLIDAASFTGSFSNLIEGQFVAVGAGGFYQFTYELGGTPGQIGLVLVVPPPPSTYNWLGDGADGNNLSWTDTMIKWEDVDNSLNPATNPPGGFAGGNDADTVIITNTRSTGTETVRINNLNVGTVADLTVGGGLDTTLLQVRGNGGVITIGDLTLGAGGAGGVGGQLLVNNAGSSAIVTGDVISGSDHPGNRIIVGNNAAGGLTLNGISGAGTGLREIDLFIQADDDTNPGRIDLGTSLFYSLDEFRVGGSFNGTNDATFTLDSMTSVSANFTRVSSAEGNLNNFNQSEATGVLTVTNASIENPGGTGENGSVQLGYMIANKPEGGTSEGTLNVGPGGTVTATNVLQMGSVTLGANLPAGDFGDITLPNPEATADGILNVNAVDSVVSIGRVNTAGTLGGGINAGLSRAGTGVITLNDGTLNSFARLYLGGDSNQGADRFTTGTLNILGGTVNHGADPNFTANGGAAGLNGELDVFGSPRNDTVALGGANLEVGRDGTGTLDQDAGTLNIFRGNLVLGQDGAGAINGTFDGNMDGTTDDLVGLANFDVRDERNQLLISTVVADGDIVDNGTPDADGAINYILTAQGLGKVLPNASRGTVDLSDGTINVGATQGLDPDTGTELFHNVAFNGGGGDMVISGGTMNVEQNFNMGAVDPGQPRNSLIVSGSGALNIGFGTAGNLAGQASDITIQGGFTNVDISGNLVLNGGSDLTFDFAGGAITDFNFDVAGNAALGGAELFLTNITALSGPTFGNILLIDATANPGATVFSNVAESDPFGNYFFTYALGGVPGQIGLSDGAGVPDTDGDGISDAYELANTDPSSATALVPAEDDDNDGFSNFTEAQFGTASLAATGAGSFPQLVFAAVDAGVNATLELSPVFAGIEYQLRGSDDLTPGSFVPLGATVTATAGDETAGSLQFPDPGPNAVPFQAYDVQVVNNPNEP